MLSPNSNQLFHISRPTLSKKIHKISYIIFKQSSSINKCEELHNLHGKETASHSLSHLVFVWSLRHTGQHCHLMLANMTDVKNDSRQRRHTTLAVSVSPCVTDLTVLHFWCHSRFDCFHLKRGFGDNQSGFSQDRWILRCPTNSDKAMNGKHSTDTNQTKLERGPMPNVMVAQPNIGGTLCSTPQTLADAY